VASGVGIDLKALFRLEILGCLEEGRPPLHGLAVRDGEINGVQVIGMSSAPKAWNASGDSQMS
jgi:hypothetical protein